MTPGTQLAYYNGRYLPKQDITISPDDRGFLFADGVYDVVLAYSGEFLRFDEHLRRMQRGLRELRFPAVELDGLRDVAATLIRENGLHEIDAKVYMQVTRGAAPRSHAFPAGDVPPTVYATASPFHLHQDAWEHGARALLVPDNRWAHCDIKSIALLPNTLAFQQAREAGAHEAVFVRDGAITEGAHTNFCAVFDDTLVTAPLSNYILSGITRQIVLELCETAGIPAQEFPVFERDVWQADECMIVGTTTEITPVVRINEQIIGDGTPGPVTQTLQQAFRKHARDR